jgi:hypothetical protein
MGLELYWLCGMPTSVFYLVQIDTLPWNKAIEM